MFFVYILYSFIHDKSYVGMTTNAEKRLIAHNSGNNKSTKPYIPWTIIHIEKFDLRAEARKRELYLKSAAGRRWRNKNIKKGD